jgi:hypothetical protein
MKGESMSSVLARLAPTGIYLLHGVPRDLQRTARARARQQGASLREVLLQALREYAAGTWPPRRDDSAASASGRRPELIGRGTAAGYTGAYREPGTIDIEEVVAVQTARGPA